MIIFLSFFSQSKGFVHLLNNTMPNHSVATALKTSKSHDDVLGMFTQTTSAGRKVLFPFLRFWFLNPEEVHCVSSDGETDEIKVITSCSDRDRKTFTKCNNNCYISWLNRFGSTETSDTLFFFSVDHIAIAIKNLCL